KILTATLVFTLSALIPSIAKADELLNAIESQNTELVGSLVRYGIDPNRNTSIYNTTPLMHALDTSTVDVVKKLIDHGSKVDVADNFGTTPLIYSIQMNKLDIASVLIKKSRDINMRDNKGVSALHYAAKTGNEKLFVEVLQRGGNLRDVDNSGNNALFYAIAGRNKKMIQNLVAMNYFNLAHVNKSGETAYRVAQRYQMPDVAERLVRGRN
ncbi:MAG: ankyrin repeat protein, partial [Cocleimonas sp.]